MKWYSLVVPNDEIISSNSSKSSYKFTVTKIRVGLDRLDKRNSDVCMTLDRGTKYILQCSYLGDCQYFSIRIM